VPKTGATAARKKRKVPREAIGGELLGPGRHVLRLTMPDGGREVALSVVVGARRGPRAFVVGGTAAKDGSGLAVVRRLAAEIEPDALAGSVVAVGLAGEAGDDADADSGPRARATRWLLALVSGKAAFGIEVRSGPAGRATFPHLRADLTDERVARLARAFGTEIIVDASAGPGSLRRAAGGAGVPSLVLEGGEAGRVDPAFVERAIDGVVNLLRAAHLLRGKPEPPPWRAIVRDATWLDAPAAGWVVPLKAAGALVAEGEPLARAHDLTGHAAEAGEPLVLLGRLGPRALARAAAHAAERPRHRVGWCEWVALPELGVGRLHAKIDTGARTSALHVRRMRQVGERGGRPILEVRLPTGRHPNTGKSRVTRVEVEGWITVRDSGGHEERRPVITTTVTLGPISSRVRVSLTDRGDMLFPMLVGRTALGEDFVVDAAARNLLE
jgi:hypothetical protein